MRELQGKLETAQQDIQALLDHESESKKVVLEAEALVAAGKDAGPRQLVELQDALAEKEADIGSLVAEYETLQATHEALTKDHAAVQAKLKEALKAVGISL